MILNLALTGDRELIAKFDAMPAVVRQLLVAKITGLSLKLEAHVKADKLSGQVLHVVTGALRRSIHARPTTQEGSLILGGVASSGDVKYARIHEFGGQTPPHDIVPVKAKALAFMMGGKQVFAAIVHHPGSRMPERSFLRSSLDDMRQEIVDGMRGAVVQGAKVGAR